MKFLLYFEKKFLRGHFDPFCFLPSEVTFSRCVKLSDSWMHEFWPVCHEIWEMIKVIQIWIFVLLEWLSIENSLFYGRSTHLELMPLQLYQTDASYCITISRHCKPKNWISNSTRSEEIIIFMDKYLTKLGNSHGSLILYSIHLVFFAIFGWIIKLTKDFICLIDGFNVWFDVRAKPTAQEAQ